MEKSRSIYQRLIISWGSLISLLIALLLMLPSVIGHSEDVEWDQKEIIYIIVLAILTYLLGTLVINLITEYDNILNKDHGIIRRQIDAWRSEQESNLSGLVDTHFEKIIEDFANAHPGFIKGMYDNYPKDFMEIFSEKKVISNALKKLHEADTKRSLYVWMSKVDVAEYSSFAESLLLYTKQSLLSTTFFDNIDLLNELNKEDNDNSVLDWLIKVENRKIDEPSLDIKRVHVFKDDVSAADGKSFDGFLDMLRSNTYEKAKNNYLERYAKYQYKTWHLNSKYNPHFFGEYIIFDKQIMIQYNEDFKVLELYIGSIVEFHAKQYYDSGIKYRVRNNAELKRIVIG